MRALGRSTRDMARTAVSLPEGSRSTDCAGRRYPCAGPTVPAAAMSAFARPVSCRSPMTEILTESFCERCGTRYTFEPVDGRRKPLSKIGTLGRGIRHFVSDPGSSLDEAFAV